MWRRRLQRELGISSVVSVSVRFKLRVKIVVVDINVSGIESSPGLGARFRVRCSVRFTGIWIYIENLHMTLM